MLLYASVWNRNRRLVPAVVMGVDGLVIDPVNILKDDWRPVRFGLQDRAVMFNTPKYAEVTSVLMFTLKECQENQKGE